ncbi:hypothetical protein F5887DRAFT_999637 [Amanita rubescens]|nr:hypothetical protein F5887DRAFT_999637 [Amanita rubescens]
MTTQFSWFDTLHALSTCLACTTASSSTDSLHDHAHNTRVTRQSTRSGSRARAQTNTQFLTDGLRPLLQEESTDDEYADTLSLHSNVGDAGRGEGEGTRTKPPRTKSKRRGKKVRQDNGWFTIFGYSLFGKRTGAIQLPLTDDEDEEEPNRSEGRIIRTRSGSTLDSDAAQLDDAAIAALSRAHIADQDAAKFRERVKQAEKEERRRKRKERKQREALERALAAGLSLDRGGFEGYQGSGDDVMVPGPGNPPHSASSRSTGTSITLTEGDADDEELADFDGSVYARAAVNVTGAGGNSSGSRTTTSTNTRSSGASGSRRHRSYSRTHETVDPLQLSPALEPLFAAHPPNSVNDQVKQKRTLPSSSSVAASDSGRTTSTRSITDSLPSPTGSTSLGPGLSLSLSSPHDQAQVSQQPHLIRDDGKTQKPFDKGLGQGRPFYDREPNRGFPSVGFGRGRGDSLVNGAFLARRGDV